MTFFNRLSIPAFVARPSRVRVTAEAWDELIDELGRRGRGERESGAFLLASRHGRRRATVQRVTYFDDVDPTCLTGGITLQSSGFTALWRICAAHGLRVIADVHTHPGGWVEQSEVDQANPMIATLGHVAIIVPSFAAERTRAGDCGVHVYLGSHRWNAALGPAAARLLYIGRWA